MPRLNEDFTHVQHFKEAGFYNGDGIFVKTPFTIVTRLEGNDVHYKVGFCSRNEKNYVKKKGIQSALDSEHKFVVRTPEINFHDISNAVIHDLVRNHWDIMPNAHRRWSALVNKIFDNRGW